MIEIRKFEKEVLDMLLAGEDKNLSVLRRQAEKFLISERVMTDSGFYVNFDIPDEVERISNQFSGTFGDVEAVIPGLNSGAGFLLWIKEGALFMLEGYTYEEPWPNQILNYKLKYSAGVHRDMNFIKSIFTE